MTLYASLVNALHGIYYPMPANDEHTARLMINSSSLRKHWCSIYTEAEVDEAIDKWGGVKLPDRMAANLDWDHHTVVSNGGTPLTHDETFALVIGGR